MLEDSNYDHEISHEQYHAVGSTKPPDAARIFASGRCAAGDDSVVHYGLGTNGEIRSVDGTQRWY